MKRKVKTIACPYVEQLQNQIAELQTQIQFKKLEDAKRFVANRLPQEPKRKRYEDFDPTKGFGAVLWLVLAVVVCVVAWWVSVAIE